MEKNLQMKEKAMKPKFKIDNIVIMKDNFHFNDSEQAFSIGKIEAIHIQKNRITYSVSGFSLRPDEKDLKIIK